MIRDIFVSKEIKNLYEKKPLSIKEFIKLFQKSTGIKIWKNIKKVLIKMYPTSYTTKSNPFVWIYGGRFTGKSLLSELISLYDSLKYVCLKNKEKVCVCVLSEYLQNFLFNSMKQHYTHIEMSDFVSFIVITKNTKSELHGRNVYGVIDDNRNALDSQLQFIATSKFLEGTRVTPYSMFHYIITQNSGDRIKTTIESETIRYKIFLKDKV